MKELYSLLLVGAACCASGAVSAEKPSQRGASKLLMRVAPEYPKAALQSNIEGCVLVSYSIAADGHPVGLAIVDAVPTGVFEGAALEAFRQWQYETPVACEGRYYQHLDFKIRGSIPKSWNCQPAPKDGCETDTTDVWDTK